MWVAVVKIYFKTRSPAVLELFLTNQRSFPLQLVTIIIIMRTKGELCLVSYRGFFVMLQKRNGFFGESNQTKMV